MIIIMVLIMSKIFKAFSLFFQFNAIVKVYKQVINSFFY